MKVRASVFTEFEVCSRDGHDSGKVKDLYFDEDSGLIERIVVQTGWLWGKNVFISPTAIIDIDPSDCTLILDLTKKEIHSAPSAPSARSVRNFSRQQLSSTIAESTAPSLKKPPRDSVQEASDVFWQGNIAIQFEELPSTLQLEAGSSSVANELNQLPLLRSLNQTLGYDVNCTDGFCGVISDAIIDDDQWLITYLILRIPDGRKNFVLAPFASGEFIHHSYSVEFSCPADHIVSSPRFDPHTPLTSAMESELESHYVLLNKPYNRRLSRTDNMDTYA